MVPFERLTTISDLDNCDALKSQLLDQIQGLTRSQALFPTQTESTRSIDALIQTLERVNPNPNSMQAAALPLLLGDWQLIYASRGTVVTRKLADSTPAWLSGIELQRISQQLTMHMAGMLAVTNAAELSLPILGTWCLTATGTWQVCHPQQALVRFDTFSLQAIHFGHRTGWKLPTLKIPVFESLRKEATWTTSYLDSTLRIGRGATGNLFVFCRNIDR